MWSLAYDDFLSASDPPTHCLCLQANISLYTDGHTHTKFYQKDHFYLCHNNSGNLKNDPFILLEIDLI